MLRGRMKIVPLEAVQNRRVEAKAAARGVSKSSRRRLPCAPRAWCCCIARTCAKLRSRPVRTQNARAKLRDSFWRAGATRDDSDNHD